MTDEGIHINESMAIEAFKELRLKKGIVCKKCKSKEHYWLKPKKQFQCKACRFRTTLRSGTVLEGSKLPIRYFFIALSLLSTKGNAVQVEELQQHTKHKYYEPLWELLRKVKAYIKDIEQQSPPVLSSIETPFIVSNTTLKPNNFQTLK